MSQQTAMVDIGSDLERRKWVMEGLLQAKSKSFWAPYTALNRDAVVFQQNNTNAADGHTVVFDFDGNLSGKAIKGKDTAFGRGEQKKKFSDKLTVERYRLVVDNGDRFDGVNIGNLAITQHQDSRAKLADLFVRFKDQAIFDAAQGFKDAKQPSHSIKVDASSTAMNYQTLVEIEKALRTGTGFKTGAFGSNTNAAPRAPLTPYRLKDGRSIWLMVIDPFTAANIKGNTAAGSIMSVAQNADIRGDDNRVFRGLIGMVGQLVLVEAEAFFGSSTGYTLSDSEIEIAGMRQWDADNSKWSGEAGFVAPTHSRNLLLGASGIQMAFGKQPDYKWQPSQDFGIKSESALEVWMEVDRVNLKAENSDYKAAKRADLDHGVIALDVKL